MCTEKSFVAAVVTGLALMAVHVGGDASPGAPLQVERANTNLGLAALLAPMGH